MIRQQLQIAGIVTDYPAVIRIGVRRAAIGDINNSTSQRQGRTLDVLARHKSYHAAGTADARSRHGRRHLDRAERSFRAVNDVQGVNLMVKTGTCVGFRAGERIHM